MKYKVLEREDYAEELDFRFYIDKCEDTSGNIIYCLVACDKCKETYLLENSEFIAYTQINTAIKDFLLNKIIEHLWVEADFHNLESIKIKQLEYGIKINSIFFKINKYHGANDYDALYEETINYIFSLWELKEYGGC